MSDDATRHREKMEKRKAVQDAEVAEKTLEKGLLLVHTGPGKGKSTAALGLMLRALGREHGGDDDIALLVVRHVPAGEDG